jgi:hypothetical protein
MSTFDLGSVTCPVRCRWPTKPARPGDRVKTDAHRSAYRVGKTMRNRWELVGPAEQARGDDGDRRLHHRWNTMRVRHKCHVVANVAIARELADWCWSPAASRSSPRDPLQPNTPSCGNQPAHISPTASTTTRSTTDTDNCRD